MGSHASPDIYTLALRHCACMSGTAYITTITHFLAKIGNMPEIVFEKMSVVCVHIIKKHICVKAVHRLIKACYTGNLFNSKTLTCFLPKFC